MSVKMRCRCGSENVIPIQYGLPSPTMSCEAFEGKIKLGGCMRKEENFHCRDCGLDFKGGKR